jgi:hypothetical protein
MAGVSFSGFNGYDFGSIVDAIHAVRKPAPGGRFKRSNSP